MFVNFKCVMLFPALLSTLIATVLADCGPDGVKCCLTEFLSLVSPSGINLSELKLSSACTTRDATLLCLADYSDQCVSPTNEGMEEAINKTKLFINHVCQSTSDFKNNVSSFEDCFQNSTESFQQCYNRTLQPVTVLSDDKSKWKAECCDYKSLRDCAVQTVENVCGQTASQVVQEDVTYINGAALELACKDIFRECNSAMALASSLLLLFISTSIHSYLRIL